jgi:signal transduction histidine kinase
MGVASTLEVPAAPGSYRIPGNPLRAWVSAPLWLANAHLALGIAAALVFSTLVILLLAVSLGLLLVLLVGIALWVAGVPLLYVFADLERARYRALLGVDIAAISPPAKAGPWWRDAWRLATCATTWRLTVYFVLRVPISALTATATGIVWALPITLMLIPAYYRRDPDGTLPHLHAGPLAITRASTAWQIAASAAAFLLFITPLLIGVFTALDIAFARALLAASPSSLRSRVAVLEHSRQQVLDSAEQERRRIERDLHDGAQQHLVSLAIALGRARARLGPDTDTTALELIDEARRDARQAITELRDLTRGLHPPILTDRGLDAALSALAARAPIPVSVEVSTQPRPSSTIEAITYFIVAEALTNVAKHARASHASVRVTRAADQLRVVISDDGRGGADPARGSGLAGLADRVAGVDGQFSLTSPAGGPSVLEVSLPCES